MSVTSGKGQKVQTGLIRRGGRYSLRRVIPLDLQARLGRKEIVKALGTSDPKVARVRLPEEWQKLDAEFARLRQQAGTEIRSGPEDYFGGGPVESLSPTLVSMVELDRLREERDQAYKAGALGAFNGRMRDTLRLIEAMLDGDVETSHSPRELEGKRNAIRALLTGDGALALSSLRPRLEAQRLSSSKGDLTLDGLFMRWAAERKPTERTLLKAKQVIEIFKSHLSSRSLAAIARRDVLAFKDACLDAGQSASNVKTHISLLSAVFGYGVDNELLGQNPASKIRVPDKRKARSKRREFTAEALNRIYSSPVYAEALRPVAGGGEAAYWLPLLGLFTGARLNELGQLHPEDVYEEGYRVGAESRSAWVIRFVNNAERGQALKTEGSERRVPVHTSLLDLGFVDFVRAAKAKNQTRLFPDLKADRFGNATGNWSKWFGRYRRKHCGVTDVTTPFHSFRHSFKHYARLSQIPSEVHHELTGHETGDVGDTYGGLSFPLHPLVEAVNKFSVPDLKLPTKVK
jgi:integrase